MSAAARTVHLTQPALSRSLKVLEEEIGVPVFDRRGRGLVLTPAGRALVPRARALLGTSERVVREVARAAERSYYDVRIGAVDSVATYLMPRLVGLLKEAFASLAIKLSTARTPILLRRVREGELDLAIIAHSGPPDDVRSHRAGAYSLQFFGRRDLYPELAKVRTEAELQAFPIVEIDPGQGQTGLVPKDALSYALASNVASVKALVVAGFGVGDLPSFMISKDEERTLVRARVPHDPDCGVFVVGSPAWRQPVETKIERTIVDGLRRVLR
ncbi:MAG TPA: LysR family transcriptional regulator [Labilithrix sp.]|nr:LysR family transcriptional regulator [Labilithrix sp.]